MAVVGGGNQVHRRRADPEVHVIQRLQARDQRFLDGVARGVPDVEDARDGVPALARVVEVPLRVTVKGHG